MSNHPIIHIEFSSKNREIDAGFFSELFGWSFNQMPEMDYATFEAKGGPGGGLNPIQDEYPAGTIMVYVHTDNIDETFTKAVELGGKIVRPKSEIPGVGWYGFFTDLTGNTIALLQPLEE